MFITVPSNVGKSNTMRRTVNHDVVILNGTESVSFQVKLPEPLFQQCSIIQAFQNSGVNTMGHRSRKNTKHAS